MPVIDHGKAPEVPWRPGYRRWPLAGGELGLSCTLESHVVEPGSGAPPHYHQVDELIVVLEGTLEVHVGEAAQQAGKNHTVAIPTGLNHSFTSVGPGPARILVFLPAPDPFSDKHTTYLNP